MSSGSDSDALSVKMFRETTSPPQRWFDGFGGVTVGPRVQLRRLSARKSAHDPDLGLTPPRSWTVHVALWRIAEPQNLAPEVSPEGSGQQQVFGFWSQPIYAKHVFAPSWHPPVLSFRVFTRAHGTSQLLPIQRRVNRHYRRCSCDLFDRRKIGVYQNLSDHFVPKAVYSDLISGVGNLVAHFLPRSARAISRALQPRPTDPSSIRRHQVFTHTEPSCPLQPRPTNTLLHEPSPPPTALHHQTACSLRRGIVSQDGEGCSSSGDSARCRPWRLQCHIQRCKSPLSLVRRRI